MERLSLLVEFAKVYLPSYDPAKVPLPSKVAEHSKSFSEDAKDIRHVAS
jgi:hypothetical protein